MSIIIFKYVTRNQEGICDLKKTVLGFVDEAQF